MASVDEGERLTLVFDGGSLGNPGKGYGSFKLTGPGGLDEIVRLDLGNNVTNNQAEYRTLIAGLERAFDWAQRAGRDPHRLHVMVATDSKLVVEQMSGRWKVKHPDMRPLAMEANRLAPFGTTYTWVPREQNKYADRLANEALDGKRDGVTVRAVADEESLIEEIESADAAAQGEPPASIQSQARGWSVGTGDPTTLVLVRHGVTVHTAAKRFSGGLGGDNPGLSDDGRAQMRATAEWLAPIAERVDPVTIAPSGVRSPGPRMFFQFDWSARRMPAETQAAPSLTASPMAGAFTSAPFTIVLMPSSPAR